MLRKLQMSLVWSAATYRIENDKSANEKGTFCPLTFEDYGGNISKLSARASSAAEPKEKSGNLKKFLTKAGRSAKICELSDEWLRPGGQQNTT